MCVASFDLSEPPFNPNVPGAVRSISPVRMSAVARPDEFLNLIPPRFESWDDLAEPVHRTPGGADDLDGEPGASASTLTPPAAPSGVDVVPTGWTLAEHPMPPFDDKPWTAVEKPDSALVRAAVDDAASRWENGQTVVIHCSHGRDRTGLIVALLGIRLFGWTKEEALHDMLRHGFRWELPGLDAYFVEYASEKKLPSSGSSK